MMERKFTDDEIVKALECCSKDSMLSCRNCPYEESCNMGRSDIQKDALDLINRQKAEIEILKEAYAIYEETTGLKWVRAEAIKEFADRLNKEAENVVIDREGDFVATNDKIYDTVSDWCKETSDNLLKEMTGENNGN